MRSHLRTSCFRAAWLVVSLLSAAPPRAVSQLPLNRTSADGTKRRADDAVAKKRPAAEAAYAEAQRLQALADEASARRAVGKYEEALALWRAAGDAGGMAKALRSLGQSHSRLGATQLALDFFNQSLALCPSSEEAGCEAAARNELSAAYLILGEPEKALEQGSGALELSRARGDRAGEAAALNNVGEVYYLRGDREKSLEHYRLALPVWKAVGDLRGQAQTLLYIGESHFGLGDAQAAAAHYEQALALWREGGDVRGQADTLTAIGHLHNGFGERQAALEFYDRAAALFRRLGDRLGEARTLNGIGYLYKELGEGRKAVGYFKQARELFRSVGYKLGEASTLEITGKAYHATGDHRAALDSYQESLALARSLANEVIESLLLADMGVAYAALGEQRKGLEYCEQALALHRKLKDRVNECRTLSSVARLREGLGEKREALAVYNEALSLARATGVRPDELDALYNVARVESELDDWAAARAHAEEALALSDALRTKVAGQSMRASYSASAHRLSELHVNVLMRLHEARPSEALDAAAFEASERGRARALLEALAEAREGIRQGADARLLERERDLQRRISIKAGRAFQLASGRASAEELAAVRSELAGLTTEYQQVQGQIRASSPRYAALVQPSPLTLAEVQQKVLDADTLLLQYSLGEERSFVWAVTPDSVKSFELRPRAEVEEQSRRVYELLTARNREAKGETGQQRRARLARADAEYAEASAALSRLVLGPVAAELGRKRLVVVADGALQYISFAALPVPRGDEAGGPPPAGTPEQPRAGFTPLIAEHEVVTLPSASVMALIREGLRGRRPAPRAVAVLADPVFDAEDERVASGSHAAGRRPGARRPAQGGGGGTGTPGAALRALRNFEGFGEGEGLGRLLFSRREANAIMASVPAGEGMLALGFGASRAVATSPALSQYRIVHFATHGLLNSEFPELSGIVLSLFDEAGARQDGFLQLHEIYNLDLPADLVVLSACQTALGKEVRGEGLMGLTRGFMYAGAARVIASLWKVDDAATAELMGEFYRAMLGEGMRPAEALRAAQVRMWQKDRWQSPYYWAAFTLQGEWR